MRIIFCIPSLGKGGAERVVSNLANYFSKWENEILILVNSKKNIGYELNDKIQILELDNKKTFNPLIRNIRRLKRIIDIVKVYNADAIISFLPMPSFRVLFLKKKLNCKIIVSDRNDPKKEYKKIISNVLMRILYPKADGFVFQTKDQRAFFSDKIQKKSVIILNPLKDEFLQHNESSKKENVIINVGRLVEQKNQKLLINAFNRIKDKYPNFNLKIYGDGPLKNELLSYINDLNLTNRVEICGTVDNIREKLETSKIFVLSSNYEGLPNALLEAMACGLPCISTDCPCGGPKEIINNKENGILINVDDEIALAKAIDDLISNENKMKNLGSNALKIKEILDPNIVNKKWEQYIKSVVENDKNNN